MESYVQDNIKTDWPGNQLFYTINRIPPSEENYNPRRVKSLAKNDKIQVLIIDTDGTGTKAKNEVNKVSNNVFFKFVLNSERFQLKKGIAKLDGVSNVEVTTSGRPSIGSGF